MAFMPQEKKKQIAAKLKQALKGTGVKYTLGVRNHSTIVMNIKSGPVDFFADLKEPDYGDQYRIDSIRQLKAERKALSVNPYHFQSHYTGKSLKVLTKAFECLNDGNWDKSDIMTDYFNVGWYVDVNIGKWNKPYILTEK